MYFQFFITVISLINDISGIIISTTDQKANVLFSGGKTGQLYNTVIS